MAVGAGAVAWTAGSGSTLTGSKWNCSGDVSLTLGEGDEFI
jgi:hypothetical protein